MNNAESLCVLCLREIGQKSREHVIPAALGWDQTIPCVCGDCNSPFGSKIDAKLASSLEYERWLLGITDRDGRAPKLSVIADEGDWKGRKVGWGKNGIIFPPDAALPQEDGSYRTFESGPPPESLKIKAEELGGELIQCGEGRSSAVQSFRLAAAAIFDPDAMRSIAKTLFNYLALNCEALCRSPDFDAFRRYLTSSGGCDPRFVLPIVPVIEPPFHRLLVIMNEDGPIIHGVVELFGLIAVHVVLANKYRGPATAMETVIDPVKRRAVKNPGPLFDLEEALSIPLAVFEPGEAMKDYWISIFDEAVESRTAFYDSHGVTVSTGRPEGW